MAPGLYKLLVGWYDPITGKRVLLADGTDVLELAQWAVE
jgi:hypothetical protein